ncbi:MAG: hypothetical protein ACK5UG_02185 [Synechococcaceae cyanobacterium]|jgi:predicted nucleotidyltransferase
MGCLCSKQYDTSVAHPCTSRAEVLAVLREHFVGLAAEFKLSSLQLFGSFATDEATASSRLP